MHTKEQRVALVTGASRGIGRAIALRLARDGYALAVNYAGNRAAADEVVATIAATGGRALAVQADIADPDQVAALFATIRETWGRLDVVVNSAGMMALAPIADGRLADFDRIVATNLRGAYLVLGHAAREIADGGRIVALSTSVIGTALPGYGAYIAAKAGVEGLVRVLAKEVRGRGVTANAIAPGPVATELFLDGKTEEQIAQHVRATPLERLGTPEDIAGTVAFLAGPDGGWVNGQVLRANGGLV